MCGTPEYKPMRIAEPVEIPVPDHVPEEWDTPDRDLVPA